MVPCFDAQKHQPLLVVTPVVSWPGLVYRSWLASVFTCKLLLSFVWLLLLGELQLAWPGSTQSVKWLHSETLLLVASCCCCVSAGMVGLDVWFAIKTLVDKVTRFSRKPQHRSELACDDHSDWHAMTSQWIGEAQPFRGHISFAHGDAACKQLVSWQLICNHPSCIYSRPPRVSTEDTVMVHFLMSLPEGM